MFHSPKGVTTGSKRAKYTCLSSANGPTSLLEKRVFDMFFHPYLVPKVPISKALWDFPWPKTRHHRLKMG